MRKNNVSFEDWFELLQMNLQDEGIDFNDEESVRADYEEGKSLFDVIDEIHAEYN